MNGEPSMRELVRLAKMGRRAEQRGEAVQGCLSALFTWVLVVFTRGWMAMLAVGVIRNDWWHGMPALGFWSSVALSLLLGWAVPNVTAAKKKDGGS